MTNFINIDQQRANKKYTITIKYQMQLQRSNTTNTTRIQFYNLLRYLFKGVVNKFNTVQLRQTFHRDSELQYAVRMKTKVFKYLHYIQSEFCI